MKVNVSEVKNFTNPSTASTQVLLESLKIENAFKEIPKEKILNN